MAQVLVTQPQAAGGNPASPLSGSESPSLMGGDKITRAQAKKKFKDEVDVLVQAVDVIRFYADALAQLNKGQTLSVTFKDANGQPQAAQIGRKHYRELISQVTKRMQNLVRTAFSLNKTRRRTGPNAGFLAPAQFNQDIVDFFSRVPLGPYVQGNLVLKMDKSYNKRSVPDSKSLAPVEGSPLNNQLLFTQPQINGRRNPLYGIIAPGTLTPLFALHAHYAQNPDGTRQGLQVAARDPQTGRPVINPQTSRQEKDSTRLTASREMREILGNVMAQTIQNDARVIVANHPELAAEVQQKAQQLIQAIQDPSIFVDSMIGRGTSAAKEMFNPNYFLYAHFSKLISNGKVAAEPPQEGQSPSQVQGLTSERLEGLRPEIVQVFGPLIQESLDSWQRVAVQGSTPEERELGELRVRLMTAAAEVTPEQNVLTRQQDDVAKARAYKNQVQGKINRQRSAEQKRAQQQAQQQAMAGISPQGIIGAFPAGIQGLPGGVQGLGGVTGLGGVPGLPGGVGGAGNTYGSPRGSGSRSGQGGNQ